MDLDAVASLQEHGQTLDLDPPTGVSVWSSPAVVTLAVVAGCSVFANLVALAIWLAAGH